MLYDVIFMFYNLLWGFTNDPFYLVYNYLEQETPVLCIFNFQKPLGAQKDMGFSEA